MKFVIASLFTAVMLAMTFVGTGCTTGQIVSDEALAGMEPENRVKYYNGLGVADMAVDAAKEAIKVAREAYVKTYDPQTGLPLVPTPPVVDPVE